MKTVLAKWAEILIETINYVIISYALNCVMIVFQTHWLWILIAAAKIWLFSNFFISLNGLTKNRIVSLAFLTCGLVGTCLLIYFIGYIEGNLVSFAA